VKLRQRIPTSVRHRAKVLRAWTFERLGSIRYSRSTLNREFGFPALRTDFGVIGEVAPTTWTTYEGSGVVVHPSILENPPGFEAHRYWAAATPYPGSDNQLENPSIFVSEDGFAWTAPEGVTNPLVDAPADGYNSDVCLVLVPNASLLMFYRECASPEPKERIRLMTSVDGIAWTPPATVMTNDSTEHRIVSPAVWFDPPSASWVMVAVDIAKPPHVLRRYLAPEPAGPWVETARPTCPSLDSEPWHIEARVFDGRVFGLLNTVGRQNWLVVSDDHGKSFSAAAAPLVTTNSYKSALITAAAHSGLLFDIWIGGNTPFWGVTRVLVSQRA
jgi:hypothetical protein